MEQLAEELRPHNVASIFVYTHEAHPGEYYPHHTSFEQKMAHARAFKELFEVQRPILVDSLDGACHRAYGGMPNMSWVFDRRGRPVYKAGWTDVASIESAIRGLLDVVEQRRGSRRRMSPFVVHRLEYRPNDPEAFKRGLERNGPKAVAEFAAQTDRWRRRATRE